jgi:hypothetical protein
MSLEHITYGFHSVGVSKSLPSSADKVPENVLLLSAVQEVLKSCKMEAFAVVEKRLQNPHLRALDLYLLCLILQGVAGNVVTAKLRMECCSLAQTIKSRAKVHYFQCYDQILIDSNALLTGHLPKASFVSSLEQGANPHVSV